MQADVYRSMLNKQTQWLRICFAPVHIPCRIAKPAPQRANSAASAPVSLTLGLNRPFPGIVQKSNLVAYTTSLECFSETSRSRPMQDPQFKIASGCKQHPMSLAIRQSVLLGAAAFIAAPLLVVLDVAEQVALTLQRIMQWYQQLKGQHSEPMSVAATASASRDSQSQQQLMQQINSPQSLPLHPSSRHSNHRVQLLGKQQPQSSSSGSSRPHRGTFLPDLWPPFGLMSAAVIPLLVLIIKHAVIGSHAVVQPLLWCAASFPVQGYVNLVLAALQRLPAAAAAATPLTSTVDSHCSGGKHRSLYWESPNESPHEKASSEPAPAATETRPVSDALVCTGTSNKQQSQQQQRSQQSRHARFVAMLFRVVQLAGDSFRFSCMCLVAWLWWQQHAPAVLQWISNAATLLDVLWHRFFGDRMASTVPINLMSLQEQLSALQQPAGRIWWFVIEVVAWSVTAAVYAMACAARLLPVVVEQT